MNNQINKNSLSVVVPYHRNAYGLVYTLTMLQNQTEKPDKIIIIDTSTDKSGLQISRIFSYGEIPIIVEVAQVHIYQAWNKGVDLSGKADVLIINDDLIFPINFISVLRYSIANKKALCHVPQTSSREHISRHIDQKFNAVCTNKIEFAEGSWMSGFCFLLTRECIERVGLFDTDNFTIWFGDDDYQNRIIAYGKKNNFCPINLIKGLFVYHFGGVSYGYKKRRVEEIIQKDRANYFKKYEDPLVRV